MTTQDGARANSGDETRNPRNLGIRLKLRARQGARRVRSALVPTLVAAIAAGGAWAVAHYLVGHAQPFFAPIAAWVCLGFSPDRQVRKVAELAVGVSLGLAMGELVAYVFGTGLVQIVLVIIGGSLLARFLDRGPMLTIQAGVQGIVIVSLPIIGTVDGASGRWVDAVIGSAIALLVAILTPGDVRRRSRELATGATVDLADTLRMLARGLGEGNPEKILDSLAAARGTQGVLDEWSEVVRNGQLSVRLSPASRGYLPELAELQHANLMIDRAMRNARVIARRAIAAAEEDGRDEQLSGWIDDLAGGVGRLGAALGSGNSTLGARESFARVAGQLSPHAYDDVGWRMQTLVILMRSLVVDLLRATGISTTAAVRLLPEDGPQAPGAGATRE